MRRIVFSLRSTGLAAAFIALAHVSAAENADNVAADFEKVVQPFLKQHCYVCHGPDTQEAHIRYDQLQGFAPGDRHLWTMVHEKLSAGEMPPEDEPQPTADEKKRILHWIEIAQRSAIAGSTRRLNRRELSAALKDLTGLDIDYAAALPGDGKIAGFDTGADGLQDAADSVARVMEITRRAVYGIRFLEPAGGEIYTADLKATKDARRELDRWKKEQEAYVKVRGHHETGQGLFIEPKWLGERGGLEFSVRPPPRGKGLVRVELTVAAVKYYESVPNPHLLVEIGGQDLEYREITGTLERPERIVYEVQADDLPVGRRGLEIKLNNKVELPYAVKGFANEDKSKPGEKLPGGPGLFRPVYEKKRTPPEKQPVPHLVLQSIEIQVGHKVAWPPAAWDASPGKHDDSTTAARKLLNLWMERAWRRPVAQDEGERFIALYEKLRGQGMSFDNALRAAFQSVLLSGPFRYLASPGDKDPVVAQHAIASRLSFMLTGGPPDEELRRLAAEKKLRDPKVLDAQVDRLLDDPRSQEFVRPFVTQWLEIGQPITITMDHIQKQDFRFARYLKQAMREETVAYVSKLLQENRPARELLDSDWTMMNDILAVHYGYEGIEGGQLRKVKLRADDPRGGGILSHAGIQSMLCWMGENWVIYRGAWALRHIFDDPPPPPPLEVPELNPSDGSNRGKTFRELLVQHQEHAKCAVCHKKMDPLGFAFQNFDLSGRWRKLEYDSYSRNELDGKIAWRGVGKSRPVDAEGKLPRGERFTSYAEFKDLAVKHYLDDLVRGLLKRLMLYGTGRKPGVAEMAEIRQIMAKLKPKGYPLRDVVKAVVCSESFLEG